MAFEWGNLLKGLGGATSMIPGAGTLAGTAISGVGSLYNALFGTDVTGNQSSENARTGVSDYLTKMKELGIDITKPFVSSEEKFATPWETTQGRIDQGFGNTLQSQFSQQGTAVNNALAQLGLSSGVGSSGMKMSLSSMAPMMEQMNQANTGAAMAYARPLKTTYEDRTNNLAQMYGQGISSGGQNQTTAYRSSELGDMADIIKAFLREQAGKNPINKVNYGGAQYAEYDPVTGLDSMGRRRREGY
jgi:hypothetical protein